MPSDRTVADDAGDELARRQRDLDEAREQLVATGEILRAMGTSASTLRRCSAPSSRVPVGSAVPTRR